MTHIDSCPRCDRSRWMTTGPAATGYCVSNYLGYGCNGTPINWRARAMAEKERAEKAERCLRTEEGAHEATANFATWFLRESNLAESIARRALVDGLAECERLRGATARLLQRAEEVIAAESGEPAVDEEGPYCPGCDDDRDANSLGCETCRDSSLDALEDAINDARRLGVTTVPNAQIIQAIRADALHYRDTMNAETRKP